MQPFSVGGVIFWHAHASCDGCRRVYPITIAVEFPPAEDLKLCPRCHPDFPPFVPDAGTRLSDGRIVDIMYTPLKDTRLFPHLPR